MIDVSQKDLILTKMIEMLELPDSAYMSAVERYEDLGEWFKRDACLVAGYDPHIFSQGSFRLGTAIRPLDETEEYDLDLGCKLREGMTKKTHTQKQLKGMVGKELQLYRNHRGINMPVDEKHRCWRLVYQDTLKFHMDIVPCIPAGENVYYSAMEAMSQTGMEKSLAAELSFSTVDITDDRHPMFATICNDWEISNPEGYGEWFVKRMSSVPYGFAMEKAQVDDVPVFLQKTPLQRTVQLLKRHRDQMFKNDEDRKPISIIITTLAAKAYEGESDIVSALFNILAKMDSFVNPTAPRVPNPVDPNEDFADRWAMPENAHLHLEQNFRRWLQQAKIDFEHITSTENVNFIAEQALNKLSLRVDAPSLSRSLGVSVGSMASVIPKTHVIEKPEAKPWTSGK